MRLLGLDIGQKRIGVAISDPMGIIAQGYTTIKMDKDLKKTENDILDIVKQNQVKRVIMGIPLNMNGTKGTSAKKVIEFADKLRRRLTPLKVELKLWDERLTTKQAKKGLLFADLSRNKRKKVIDMLSAQVILQSYLDSKRGGDKDV